MKQSICCQHRAWAINDYTTTPEQKGSVESGIAFVKPCDGINSITRERYATLRVDQDKIYEV